MENALGQILITMAKSRNDQEKLTREVFDMPNLAHKEVELHSLTKPRNYFPQTRLVPEFSKTANRPLSKKRPNQESRTLKEIQSANNRGQL